MKYIIANYSDESFYDVLSGIFELFMCLAFVGILVILIVYACTSSKWKKTYRLIHYSSYLAPLVYVILFFIFRLYISVLLISVLFYVLSRIERKELKAAAKQYNIDDSSSLKTSNKFIIITTTIFIICVILLYLHHVGIDYLI